MYPQNWNRDGQIKPLRSYIRDGPDRAIAELYFDLIEKFLQIDPINRIAPSKYYSLGQF